MRSTFRMLTTLAMMVGCATAADAAPQAQDSQTPAETPESRGVAQTVIVAHLVDWGRRNRDSGALLTAARMLAEVPMRPGREGDVGMEPVLTPQGLRQEAAALNRDRSDLEDVVVTGSRVTRPPPASASESPAPPPAPVPPPPPPATLPAPTPAMPMPAAPPAPIVGVMASPFGVGPISTVKRLNSRESWSFVIDARGSQLLRVAAIGDGDTNVDLIVRNEKGEVLCADGLDDHYPNCTLSPVAPARLRINVVNRGDVWTRVQVLTN